jgi:hypothetical protein
MEKVAPFGAAILILLLTIPPSYASPCEDSIARVQAQADAAIEKRAGAGGWQKESLDATRSYQPTPRSIAASEGKYGRRLQRVLNALELARAADRAGDAAQCNAQVNRAKRALAAAR